MHLNYVVIANKSKNSKIFNTTDSPSRLLNTIHILTAVSIRLRVPTAVSIRLYMSVSFFQPVWTNGNQVNSGRAQSAS